MGIDALGDNTVYGVWDHDVLVTVGTEEQLRRNRWNVYSDVNRHRYVRVLTPDGGSRLPNKWRDIAAAALRDIHGLDYEEIASILHITVGMAQGAVSRVRCGRYEGD